jgi:hypothetical protein
MIRIPVRANLLIFVKVKSVIASLRGYIALKAGIVVLAITVWVFDKVVIVNAFA